MSDALKQRVAGIERRSVLRVGAVAWSMPVIAAASAAPAFAASAWAIAGTVTYTGGNPKTYTAALTFQPGTPANPTLSLTFTLSNSTWANAGTSLPAGWTGTVTSATAVTYTYTDTVMPPAAATFSPVRTSNGTALLTIQLLVDGAPSGAPLVHTT